MGSDTGPPSTPGVGPLVTPPEAEGVGHDVFLSLPTGLWRLARVGPPFGVGDTVIVDRGLPAAVIAGVTPERVTGPPAVLLRLEGIDNDCVLPPDTAQRWERLLSGRGWTEVLIYRAGGPGAQRHDDGVDRPQDNAGVTD